DQFCQICGGDQFEHRLGALFCSECGTQPAGEVAREQLLEPAAGSFTQVSGSFSQKLSQNTILLRSQVSKGSLELPRARLNSL
ncbi:MAG: hypothetical protein MHPSP_004868, partial [Paramarteilia canceri]